MCGVDAARLEVGHCCRPEQVIAHSRHHRNTRAAQSRGDCLVRSLAAEAELKSFAKYRLAGPREAVRERSQVDISAPDHDNVRLPMHPGHNYLTEISAIKSSVYRARRPLCDYRAVL